MGLTMDELEKKVSRGSMRNRNRLKQNYDLSKRLGFSSREAVVLQSHKREVIINLAIERGLIANSTDPKAQ